MSSDDLFSGDIDPEIASLLSDGSGTPMDAPDYSSLFNEAGENSVDNETSSLDDLSRESFPEIERIQQDPQPYFRDKQFYKVILSAGGDTALQLHKALSEFTKATTPEDKTHFRGRLISLYWQVYEEVAKTLSHDMPIPRKLFMRYMTLVPGMISKDQQDIISSIILENKTGEPVHYADEWLNLVAQGSVAPLATDEIQPAKKRNQKSKIKVDLERVRGEKTANLNDARSVIMKRKDHEVQLSRLIQEISRKIPSHDYPELLNPYDGMQRKALTDLTNQVRFLNQLDKELIQVNAKLDHNRINLEKLKLLANEAGESVEMDMGALLKEVQSIRQMVKMSIGRRGNHFPILSSQYLLANITGIGTRENIIKELDYIEKVDPGAFRRTFRQKTNRIIPHVIILPCYGETGICWEPFEKFNRASSRGRIGIPMFPKNLRLSVITAVADLRWQVAKEKAQHYWMEEGLTGHYYQWFDDKKIRGDVKLHFIDDYILWISKESEGVQKLDREVRGIFWRNMSFPEELRENLRNRGFVYNELYKKDINRSISDGY